MDVDIEGIVSVSGWDRGEWKVLVNGTECLDKFLRKVGRVFLRHFFGTGVRLQVVNEKEGNFMTSCCERSGDDGDGVMRRR